MSIENNGHEPVVALDVVGESETAALAGRIAPLAEAEDVIALWGGLGVGKTVFARAFVRALLGADEEVPSPTFTLVQVYDAPENSRPPIYHFDLFRVEEPEEVHELGIEDAFAEGVSLVEWPEHLADLLPCQRLDVTLSASQAVDVRRVEISGRGRLWKRVKDLWP